jgi:glycosyltransferase involved in cell wall biosynthesis
MPRADVLTCVSKDMVQQYATVFPGSRHVHAYNIIDADSYPPVQGKLDDPWMRGPRYHTIVAAGSLEPWKGFAELIEAMTQVVRTVPDARLTILGEGSQRTALQARIDALDLGNNIRLHGNVEDPLNYFTQAGTFVLSSHVEGLPNVLVEAMLCGCTPVAANCPTGPREVLQDGRYGYLIPVNAPEALAEGILRSIAAPTPPEALSEAIREFRADSVIRRHADILGIERM